MSWDLFVQDLPPDIKSVKEIPKDFHPSLAIKREKVISAIRAVAPDTNFENPERGILDREGFSIEFSVDNSEEVDGFAMHVRGSSLDAILVTRDILEKLNLRALDSVSESGLFDPEESKRSFKKWQKYKDHAINRGGNN